MRKVKKKKVILYRIFHIKGHSCIKKKNRSQIQENSPYCQECMANIQSNDRELFKTSTKVRKVLDILKETRSTNPGEKTIIFSQFTSMLDLMEGPLKENGFKLCRCMG